MELVLEGRRRFHMFCEDPERVLDPKDCREAVEQFRKAYAMEPSSLTAGYYGMGLYRLIAYDLEPRDRTQEARTALEKGRSMKRPPPEFTYAMASLLQSEEQGYSPKAMDLLRTLLKERPAEYGAFDLLVFSLVHAPTKDSPQLQEGVARWRRFRAAAPLEKQPRWGADIRLLEALCAVGQKKLATEHTTDFPGREVPAARTV